MNQTVALLPGDRMGYWQLLHCVVTGPARKIFIPTCHCFASLSMRTRGARLLEAMQKVLLFVEEPIS